MATAFFLIVHDEFTGRPRIARGLVPCGLVGAQLADLVIGGRLTVAGDRVTVVRADVSGLDELGALVLDAVVHDRDSRAVGVWVDALGAALHDRTVRRLTADGVLRTEADRRPFRRRRPRHPAVDLVRARRPAAELREMFDDPRRFDLPAAFVASMLSTLGADDVLEPGVDRARVRSVSTQAADHLPGSLSRLRDGLAGAVAAIQPTDYA